MICLEMWSFIFSLLSLVVAAAATAMRRRRMPSIPEDSVVEFTQAPAIPTGNPFENVSWGNSGPQVPWEQLAVIAAVAVMGYKIYKSFYSPL